MLRITINNGTPHLESPKNQNRRAALGRPNRDPASREIGKDFHDEKRLKLINSHSVINNRLILVHIPLVLLS